MNPAPPVIRTFFIAYVFSVRAGEPAPPYWRPSPTAGPPCPCSGTWKTGDAARSPGRGLERTSTIAHSDPTQAAGPRLALTLHIGTGKTGTSSLQAFLRMNRARLAEAGWLYPRSVGPLRHAQFGVWLRPDEELAAAFHAGRPGTRRFATVEQLRRQVPRRLLAEVRRTGLSRVLMSDEALYGSSQPSLERLRRFTDDHASSVRLVCYLRRQDDHVVSRYQQVVKLNETRTLARRVAEMDLSATYDYYARLQLWLRVVEPDELVVRRFEGERLRNGSLYDDFVDATGVGIPTDHLPPRNRNESLDAECVEFLRLLNVYREEHPEAEDLPGNGDLLMDLRSLGTGPTLTLPDADLDRFMAQWASSNELVARELLGAADGQLFTSPRKRSGTTVEQGLDPDRISQLVGALDQLPDRFEAPLRRLAEREAARQV